MELASTNRELKMDDVEFGEKIAVENELLDVTNGEPSTVATNCSGNGYRVCLPIDIEVKDQKDIDAKLKLFFAEYKEKLKLPEFDNISDLPRIIKVPGEKKSEIRGGCIIYVANNQFRQESFGISKYYEIVGEYHDCSQCAGFKPRELPTQ
jgi:hypothetical protein